MQSFDEGRGEVFFDSFDCLSSEESVVVSGLGYDLWLSEPHSVKERRERFLREMRSSGLELGHNAGPSDRERVLEFSGAECSGLSVSSPVLEKDEDLSCSGRDCSNDAHCSVDDVSESSEIPPVMKPKNKGRWWKELFHKMRCRNRDVSDVPKQICKATKGTRLKVHCNGKKFMEFSAVCSGQEIRAHSAPISTLKFSPDGQYLASGGEDGVVRVWLVKPIVTSPELFSISDRKSDKSFHISAKIPEKVFRIAESPEHEFFGHTAGVLDLAWSKTNCLLSSSKDNTVRLWKVGSDECLGIFRHSNYVTCIQFNPVDENFFVSGSIDGKVRVWGVAEKRVVDWADAQDIITAICYQPNGRGFIVGSISGNIRFYNAGSELTLDAEIHIGGKKRSYCNRITGIQFLLEDSRRVMITSGDSKIRILDGHDVVSKFRGPAKSGSQISAAFTSTRKHVVSVGEDSRVYLWNYEDKCFRESKQVKSDRSCEHFISEGVSVAIPWPGQSATKDDDRTSPVQEQQHEDTIPRIRDSSEKFSLGNWFSIDISSRGSVTWPEEVLPLSSVERNAEDDVNDRVGYDEHLSDFKAHRRLRSPAWGLVIVTAGLDGKIRTFHNYGFPVRI